jgi:isoleucyl-tRNA synthetase/GNAT superfamily N-acetyltransferase
MRQESVLHLPLFLVDAENQGGTAPDFFHDIPYISDCKMEKVNARKQRSGVLGSRLLFCFWNNMQNPPFEPINPKADFSRIEEEVLAFWEENDCFRKSLELRKDSESFLFFDGPPFATGLPHYGHIIGGTLKDVFPRYQTMLGKHVPRRFGWDCHGVPVEHEMEKQLGFKNREDIEHYGIQNFCESCRGIVLKYTKEWKQSVTRMGRWVDFENAYRTMDPDYMEAILAVFARLWNEGYIYEGKKVVAYSPKLASTLSNFEANLNYKDIDDPAVTVKFQMTNDKLQMDDEVPTYFLAWTTTPWTLPSNMALCVNPEIEYAKISSEGEHFIVAKNLAERIFGESVSVVDTISGKDLIGTKYKPLFPFYQNLEDYDFSSAWQILGDDFVSDSDGTGIVHLAPTGEDDARILTANNIPLVYPFDPNCYFDETIPELKGKYFRFDPTVEGSKEDNANKWVLNALKESGLLFDQKQIRHSYPHCWRTDCALMYRGVHTFFVDIQRIKEKLLEKNEDINWIPSHIKHGRFGKLLENAPDWAISRSRYWGAPIPVWKCENCDHKEVAGSIKEIGEKAKKKGKIFVVRHGQGEHNVADIVSSDINDNVALTKIGKQQAEATGNLLKEKQVDVIFCSPLLRARQTAEILKQTSEIGAKIIFDERIKEIDCGTLDRATLEEWKQQFTKKNRFYENPHQGESQSDVEQRVLAFLRDVQEKHGNKNVLIVSHGAVVRTVARYFHNLSETEVFECPIETGCLHEYSFSQLPMDDFGKVDLHRPYIDKIQFDCKKCGGTMTRVPEVLDCWFESGSMPYASRWEEGKSQFQVTNDTLQMENGGAGEFRIQNSECKIENSKFKMKNVGAAPRVCPSDEIQMISIKNETEQEQYNAIRKKEIFQRYYPDTEYNPDHPDEKNPKNHPRVIMRGDTIVGVIRLDEMENNTLGLRVFAFSEEFQRKGYGKQAIRLVEEFALEKNCDKIVCNSHPSVVDFYEKLGFQKGLWAGGSDTESVPMQKNLITGQTHGIAPTNDNCDTSTVNLTADFIAEGLDQTRGWFYTLHVLGNALFGQPVFKNVIVNGIVLAEDGQKMSKSKKNYPDPQLVFDKYGADAMRFYLMNSPAVRADDLRFSEEGVLEVMRKVLLPIWNAYSFFVTYANIDKWNRELKMKNDEGGQIQMTNDKLQMKAVETDHEWEKYHEILKTEIFERYHPDTEYNTLHPDLKNPRNHPQVILVDGKIIGAMRLDELKDKTLALRSFAIGEDFQKKGYGEGTIRLVEKFAHEKGRDRIVLNAQPAATTFYEKCGFNKDFWKGDSDFNSIPMGKYIQPPTSNLQPPTSKLDQWILAELGSLVKKLPCKNGFLRDRCRVP